MDISKYISSNPKDSSFYYPIIFGLFCILGSLQLIIDHLKEKSSGDLNNSINKTYVAGNEFSITFVQNQKSLKFRYIIAYLLTRASVWAKSPYIWSMYLVYHGFTVSQIGVLYVIDAISALLFGPIMGNMADMFGRKRFCQIYNITTILSLGIRLSGDKPLAYVAQILTGLGSGLGTTSYESWVVSEANKEFKYYEQERERFLKKLFKTVQIYDSGVSIICSSLAAVVYVFFLYRHSTEYVLQ